MKQVLGWDGKWVRARESCCRECGRDDDSTDYAFDLGLICRKCKNEPHELSVVVWEYWDDSLVAFNHGKVPMWKWRPDFEQYVDRIRQVPEKEYWYFLRWSHNNGYTIGDVRTNIDKFVTREALGIIACDIVLEHGEKKGRAHYHMRLKTTRPLKKQKLDTYARMGFIHYQPVHKHTQENWDNIRNYMSKESELECLVRPPEN